MAPSSNLHGGDSSGVKDQLVNVDKIAANICSFAAIRHDGSVVTWGVPGRGGDSSAVQDQLKNVRAISASVLAFSAILFNGEVVFWGSWEPTPLTPP